MSRRSEPVVVGVTAYAEPARWGDWDVPAVLLPASYVSSVRAAGGVPVLLPPLADASVSSRLDALVIAGGPDVDAALYGASRGPHTAVPREARDAFEVSLCAAASSSGLPVLGVCRGMQVMNVSRGGTLLQHLPDVLGHSGHAPGKGVYGHHTVTLEPDSLTARSLGAEKADVPTYHHQSIDRLGAGLVATGWTDDGVVEAVEDPELPFHVGVQWHPEVSDDVSLFRALVEAADRRRPA